MAAGPGNWAGLSLPEKEKHMDLIKLQAPEGTTSASVGGEEYPVDANGWVSVPVEHALTLYPFGFGNVTAEAEAAAQAAEAEAAARRAQDEANEAAEKAARDAAEAAEPSPAPAPAPVAAKKAKA